MLHINWFCSVKHFVAWFLVLTLIFTFVQLFVGKSNGYGLDSGVPLQRRGVGGRGSGSLHPSSQWVVTRPLHFSSTSPRSSIWNVPNLSRICLASSLTWIRRAEIIHISHMSQVCPHNFSAKLNGEITRPFGKAKLKVLITPSYSANFTQLSPF